MDSEFLARLRRNNLFTPENPNPLRMPTSEPIDFTALRRINAPIQDIPRTGPITAPSKPMVSQMTSIPRTTETANDYGLNLNFDRRNDTADTFAANILNPPERSFKFQDLMNKRDIALQGLDIKRGAQDIQQQRADTSQFSAETRRRLAELHDMSDSEKLKMLHEGKVTLQQLKDAASIANIKERGKETRESIGARGEENIRAIKERGEQNRETKMAGNDKPLLPTQERTKVNNAARTLVNTRPDLAKYVTFDPNTNDAIIDPNTPLAEMSMIRAALYGDNKDKKLPFDKKNTPVDKKKNDPLGIR